jgi:hypothetical protein
VFLCSDGDASLDDEECSRCDDKSDGVAAHVNTAATDEEDDDYDDIAISFVPAVLMMRSSPQRL